MTEQVSATTGEKRDKLAFHAPRLVRFGPVSELTKQRPPRFDETDEEAIIRRMLGNCHMQ